MIFPPWQVIKFQGPRPMRVVMKIVKIEIPKCGNVTFIIQFGDPGNILRKVK
jgi:hypothetical protein